MPNLLALYQGLKDGCSLKCINGIWTLDTGGKSIHIDQQVVQRGENLGLLKIDHNTAKLNTKSIIVADDNVDLSPIYDKIRLASVVQSHLLSKEYDEFFDKTTRLAADTLKCPIAIITVLDDHIQFFKSHVGLSAHLSKARQTNIELSFCKFVVASGSEMIINNSCTHPLVSGMRLNDQESPIAYMGFPIYTCDKQILGTLCVIDTQPRNWTEEENTLLRLLANMLTLYIRGVEVDWLI